LVRKEKSYQNSRTETIIKSNKPELWKGIKSYLCYGLQGDIPIKDMIPREL